MNDKRLQQVLFLDSGPVAVWCRAVWVPPEDMPYEPTPVRTEWKKSEWEAHEAAYDTGWTWWTIETQYVRAGREPR